MNQQRPSGAPGTEISGLALIDKPAGWTSHDVVGKVRRLAGTRKVGHAGTLDPMATGLLVIGFNKATRLLTAITGTDKTYHATIRLGASTSTDDAEGEIVRTRLANAVTEEKVLEQIGALTGDILQIPSSVSAIKVDGRRAYDRVRSGEDVALEARPVRVDAFELTDYRRADDGKTVDLDVVVSCSSGTYIRALARDLGEALDTGGHLTRLRRTRVGPFSIDNSVTLDELGQRFDYTELSAAASGLFPVRELTEAEAGDLQFGRRITPNPQDGIHAARTANGTVIALVDNDTFRGTPVAKPSIVFAAAEGPGASAGKGSSS